MHSLIGLAAVCIAVAAVSEPQAFGIAAPGEPLPLGNRIELFIGTFVGALVYFIHHIADSVQVDTLVHGARRRLLDDLLDVSRIGSGSVPNCSRRAVAPSDSISAGPRPARARRNT